MKQFNSIIYLHSFFLKIDFRSDLVTIGNAILWHLGDGKQPRSLDWVVIVIQMQYWWLSARLQWLQYLHTLDEKQCNFYNRSEWCYKTPYAFKGNKSKYHFGTSTKSPIFCRRYFSNDHIHDLSLLEQMMTHFIHAIWLHWVTMNELQSNRHVVFLGMPRFW